jgi:hypothetical protein
MKRQFYSISLVSTFLIAVSSLNYLNPVKAQPVTFDRQKCIEGMVKEGLSKDKAAVWCNYKQDCLKRSLQEGLPLDAAESVCNCAINEFRKRYSPQQFKEVTQQAETDRAVAEKLREVGEACFEEILYEE